MAEPTAHEPTFGEVFEQLRLARGLSPAQLARGLEEYEGNISRWRRGQGIDQLKVRKVADFFGVDRAWLERLAGYGDSAVSLTKENVEVERSMWHAVYDELIEKEVPRPLWQSYIEACMAMARAFRNLPGAALSTDEQDASAGGSPEIGKGDSDGPGPDLTARWPRQGRAQQPAKFSGVFSPSFP